MWTRASFDRATENLERYNYSLMGNMESKKTLWRETLTTWKLSFCCIFHVRLVIIRCWVRGFCLVLDGESVCVCRLCIRRKCNGLALYLGSFHCVEDWNGKQANYLRVCEERLEPSIIWWRTVTISHVFCGIPWKVIALALHPQLPVPIKSL